MTQEIIAFASLEGLRATHAADTIRSIHQDGSAGIYEETLRACHDRLREAELTATKVLKNAIVPSCCEALRAVHKPF